MKKTKKKIYVGSLILKILIILAAIFTVVMLGYLIVYILGKDDEGKKKAVLNKKETACFPYIMTAITYRCFRLLSIH